ncbi:MAG: YhcH/YjgK/YiaL family protein [Bacteroidales bacterium]|nr:YhcH/YjgK/YiaL family protein [Bacteroidales bacterium]MCF8391295.1 YhcH/YjgK/YiaL family protein [Bacteroidales bacterium]
MACTNTSDNNATNISNQEMEWFEKGSWREDLSMQPDETVNIKELYKQFHLKPDLWRKAFTFLSEIDLESLEVGKYELMGDTLFYIIDEYTSRDESETRFEAHRKYADIQYLISGEEKIGVSSLGGAKVLEPYDELKDIAFYELGKNNYRLADQNVFFVFFPQDAHRPCLKAENNSTVKKIVFKINLD